MALIYMLLVIITVASISITLGLVRFFFSSRRRHTRCLSDWSSDVCSSDLIGPKLAHLRIRLQYAVEEFSILARDPANIDIKNRRPILVQTNRADGSMA